MSLPHSWSGINLRHDAEPTITRALNCFMSCYLKVFATQF